MAEKPNTAESFVDVFSGSGNSKASKPFTASETATPTKFN